MRVVWSFGQVYPDYFHWPASGIESGTAPNDRFYLPDEMKYHGTRNRGAVSINFFGKSSFELYSLSLPPLSLPPSLPSVPHSPPPFSPSPSSQRRRLISVPRRVLVGSTLVVMDRECVNTRQSGLYAATLSISESRLKSMWVAGWASASLTTQ